MARGCGEKWRTLLNNTFTNQKKFWPTQFMLNDYYISQLMQEYRQVKYKDVKLEKII